MKTLVIWMLSGALLGVVVASVIVPPALSWYTAPGGLPQGTQIQALVEIPEVIRYATGRLMRGQLIGGIAGMVLGLVAGIMIGRKNKMAAEIPPPPVVGVPPPVSGSSTVPRP